MRFIISRVLNIISMSLYIALLMGDVILPITFSFGSIDNLGDKMLFKSSLFLNMALVATVLFIITFFIYPKEEVIFNEEEQDKLSTVQTILSVVFVIPSIISCLFAVSILPIFTIPFLLGYAEVIAELVVYIKRLNEPEELESTQSEL